MAPIARLIAFAFAAGLPLAACDTAPDAAPPGAVSEGEAAALDEAASMLDEQRLPEGVLPEVDAPDAPTQADDVSQNSR